MSETIHTLNIQNMGPIHEASLYFERGVNLLLGDHGAGKSTVMNLIDKRFGDGEADITVHDGAEKGTFKWNGETVLTVGKVSRKTGKIELRLSSSYPFSKLIDPGLTDPERRERARVSAIVELIRVAVTQNMIRMLIGEDLVVIDWVTTKVGIEFLQAMNIVNATDAVRLSIHDLKRVHETAATKAEGEMESLAVAMVEPENLTELSVEDATAALDAATRKHERLSGEAGQRVKQEAERKQILELNESEPNLELARERSETARKAEDESARAYTAAKHALELAEAKWRTDQATLDEANSALKTAESDATTYYKRKAILESEITGATEADVAIAKTDVDNATAELEAARASALYRQQQESQDAARIRKNTAIGHAKRYEAIATSVTGRLAKILADIGLPNLTVDERGWVCVVHPNGELETFERLSYGEKVRIAVELFARNSEDGALLPIDWRFWAALNDNMKRETRQIIYDQDLFAAVEVASSGELRTELFVTS